MIRDLLKEGKTPKEIVKQLGVAFSTVRWHARKLGMPPIIIKPKIRNFPWKEIDEYCEMGKRTRKEVSDKFGLNQWDWHFAFKNKLIHGKMFKHKNAKDSFIFRQYKDEEIIPIKEIKRRFNQKTKYICKGCKNKGTWNKKPLTLQLDHKNGNSYDCRKNNLRYLCPNCHSQTKTFGSKNMGYGRKYRRNKAKESSQDSAKILLVEAGSTLRSKIIYTHL